MKKTKFHFTKTILSKLPIPETGFKSYADTKEKGLKLYITSKGTKSFFVRKFINKRDERILIGCFPDVGIELARKKALQIKAKLSQGINPNEEKQNLREDITIQEAFNQFMERYSKKHNKPRTIRENLGVYERYIKHWQNRPLKTLSRNEIEKWQTKIGNKNGLYAGNSFLKFIRLLFNKAIDWGWKGLNPTLGIKKFKEKSRDRFIQPNELKKFFKSLNEETNELMRDYIFLSLLTGQRRSNVVSMQWSEIDFERKIWRIPETKNGESLNVPLVKQAIDILKTIEKTNKSKWIFPSQSSKSGHLEEPKKVWRRILERAKIRDLRLHDLRRTMGSYQALTGSSLPIIGKSLGHKTSQATQIYARLNDDPIRNAFEKATEKMMGGNNEL
ncbi:MAG: tyrosine-type recombinase/integrase [Alphaproteobacteria bacterium]